jgi:hypothetical protein
MALGVESYQTAPAIHSPLRAHRDFIFRVSLSSHFGHAAVDRKFDAAYEASLGGSEKGYNRRDFVRPAHSPYGDLSHHGGGDLRRIWMFITQVVVERVSMGPGLTALTRMRRAFSSIVQVRAKARNAALAAL